MNIKKMASQDAFKWARAEMFFGEGAGTRRKLLHAEVSDKMRRIPEYRASFDKAYAKQNFTEHAIKAAKERKRIDHVGFVNKNAKAIVRGRPQDISPALIVIALGAFALHETGYDKVIIDKVKGSYRRFRADVEARRAAK